MSKIWKPSFILTPQGQKNFQKWATPPPYLFELKQMWWLLKSVDNMPCILLPPAIYGAAGLLWSVPGTILCYGEILFPWLSLEKNRIGRKEKFQKHATEITEIFGTHLLFALPNASLFLFFFLLSTAWMSSIDSSSLSKSSVFTGNSWAKLWLLCSKSTWLSKYILLL